MNFHIARSAMVAQQIRPWHVLNEKVLNTLSHIPREMFVPQAYLNLAYSDNDIPLSGGQTLLAPKIVGRALQALNFTGQEKVLEVGTGTGYLTACLSKLAASVISVEIDPLLLSQAEKSLATLHCGNVTLIQGDAAYGWETFAPYDAIIISGSYPLGVPDKVLSQLKTPGRLFAITGLKPAMQAVLIERKGKTDYLTTPLFETVVPALIHAPQPQKFQF